METSLSSLNHDLDLAERYLVCGMHEDAAELSKRILQRLENKRLTLLSLGIRKRSNSKSIHSSSVSENTAHLTENAEKFDSKESNFYYQSKSNNEEKDEVNAIENLIISAGAVLIQSYDSMNKVNDLHSILIQIFKNFSEIHPEIFILWVSLQVSAGEFSAAKWTIQEYFRFLFPKKRIKYDKKDKNYHTKDDNNYHSIDIYNDVNVNDASNNKTNVMYNKNEKRKTDYDYDCDNDNDYDCDYDEDDEDENGGDDVKRYLDGDQLALLATIYAVDILSNGCDDATSALHWLQNEGKTVCGDSQFQLVSKVKKIMAENRTEEINFQNSILSSSSSASSSSSLPKNKNEKEFKNEKKRKMRMVNEIEIEGEGEEENEKKCEMEGRKKDASIEKMKERNENASSFHFVSSFISSFISFSESNLKVAHVLEEKNEDEKKVEKERKKKMKTEEEEKGGEMDKKQMEKEKVEGEEAKTKKNDGMLWKKIWSPWLLCVVVLNKQVKTGVSIGRSMNFYFCFKFLKERFSPLVGVWGLSFLLLCYSIYKEKKYLANIPKAVLLHLNVGLSDLYKMAFGINLNPLSNRF